MMTIHEEGFRIAMGKELQLSREQAETFYSEHRGQPYFDELTSRTSMYDNANALQAFSNLLEGI